MNLKKLLTFFFILLFAIVLVACNNDEDVEAKVEEYIARIAIVYAEGDSAKSVTQDVTLLTSLEGIDASITWSSNNDAISNTGKVTRGETDTNVTLTVVLKYKEAEGSKNFNLVVLAKEDDTPLPTKLSTIAEVLAASEGSNVRIKGTVVAVNAKGFYVWDNTGYVQVYKDKTAFTQKVGDFVEVEGVISKYNNVNQFGSAATIKELENGETFTVTPTELDEAGLIAYLGGVELGKSVKIELTVTSASTSYINAKIKNGEATNVGISIVSPANSFSFEVGASYEVVLFSLYAKEYNEVNYLYGIVTNARLTEAAPVPVYTIEFDVDGGEPITAIKFTNYNEVELPDAEKFGYFFLGWLDEQGNDVLSITENKDYKLKAKYIIIETDLTIDVDGGKFSSGYLDSDNHIHFDHAIYSYEIEVPTKEGYVFLGWIGDDGVVEDEFAGTVNIKAKWGTTLAVYLNAGPSSELMDLVANEFLKDFHDYTGRNITKANFFNVTYSADGTPYVGDFLTSDAYKDKWAWLVSYIDSVRELVDAGSILDAASAQQRGDIHNWMNACASGEKGGMAGYGVDFANLDTYIYVLYVDGESYDLPILTVDGYDFGGWYTNPKFNGEAVTVATNGLPLYAKFTEKSYKIEYVIPEGATNSSDNPSEYTMSSDDIVLAEPNVSEGYTFTGWYLDSECLHRVTTISSLSSKDITVYARVIKGDIVTITFNYNDKLSPEEAVNGFVKDIEAISGVTGYLSTAVDEWKYESEYTPLFTVLNLSDKGESGKIKADFLAKWNWLLDIVYRAQCDLTTSYEGNVYACIQGTPDDTGIYIISQELKGIRAKAQTKAWYGATMYDWAVDSADLYNEVNKTSGTEDFVEKYVKGDKLTLKAYREGLVFIGWNTKEDGTGDFVKVIPNEEATLFAQYHVPTKLYVDPSDNTKYATIKAALDASYDEDEIYVASGTYTDNLVVDKAVKIYGPNALKEGKATDRVGEAEINGYITLSSDDVLIAGFTTNSYIEVIKDVKNLSFINNIANLGDGEGIIRGFRVDGSNWVYTTITNLVVEGNYSNAFGAPRWFRLGYLNGAKVNNNTIIGAPEKLYDVFRVDKAMYGDCQYNNNYVENTKQSVFMIMGVGGMTLEIKDNYFKDIYETAIDTRGMVASVSGNVVENIIHNTFDHAGYDWRCIRPRSLDYGTNTLDVQVHYNKFINGSFVEANGVKTYANNPTGEIVIYNMDNNYFEEVKASDLSNDNFGKAASSWANCYDSALALESGYNAYLEKDLYVITLNGEEHQVYDVINFTLPKLTREGNEFVGWFEGETLVESLTEMRSYTLKGKWLYSFTITFDSDGGTSCDSVIYVEPKDLEGKIPTPKKDGYDFGGWYNGDVEFVVSENMTTINYDLKAKWNYIYTINYDFDGGKLVTDSSTSYVQKTSLIPNNELLKGVEKEGFAFGGWYDGEVRIYSISEAKDVTLKAHWVTAQELPLLTNELKVANEYNPTIYVKSDVSDGFYKINGAYFETGENLFTTLDAALLKAQAEDVIFLFSGSYEINNKIPANVIFVGPNALYKGTSTSRGDEAIITVTKDIQVLSSSVSFIGVKVLGNGGGAGISGVTFQASANFTGFYALNSIFSGTNTLLKIQNGTEAVIQIEGSSIDTIGQFIMWVTKGVKQIECIDTYVNGATCGAVENSAATLFRIRTDASVIFKHCTFVGDPIAISGYFEARVGEGSFEVTYSDFEGVTKITYIPSGEVQRAIFDKNLYIVSGVALTESPINGDGLTKDEKLYFSIEDLEEEYAETLIEYIYNSASEVGDAYMIDFSEANKDVLKGKVLSKTQIDTDCLESAYMVTMLENKEMTAKWRWLYKAIADYIEKPEMNPDDMSAENVKGLYLANLYAFFNECKHTDTWIGTQSYDFSNPEAVAAILKAGPVKTE